MTTDNMVLQRRLVLLATLAVVIASFRHLATSYCQLEPQVGETVSLLSATCSTALFTAIAVDVAVIVLVRLALGGREVGGKIGAIVAALSLVTILSILGNLSAGLTTTVAHDGGGTGRLFTMADLQQLDGLSMGRVAVFFGLLPIVVLALTLAGARAAQNEREALRKAQEAPELLVGLSAPVEPQEALERAPRRRGPGWGDIERLEVRGMNMLPKRSTIHIEEMNGRVRKAIPDRIPENPEAMTVKGKMSPAEQLDAARRVVSSGGGAPEIAQAIDASLSTGYRLWRKVTGRNNEDSPNGRML